MQQLNPENRLGSRRCTTQSSSKAQMYADKYKLYNMKRSEPMSSKRHSSILPQIKYYNASTRNSSQQLNKQRSKPSTLVSLPDCLLVIKQQQSHLPLTLRNLLKQFNQKRKNLAFIAQLSIELREHNSLFRKLCELVTCCILRNSAVKHLEKGFYVYNKGDQSKQFYIILDGKVLLYNKKDLFKKISKQGQTISEQIVIDTDRYEPNLPKCKLEYAKCITNVIVLEIKASLYNKLYVECNARGHKFNIQTLQSIIMRNYLNKVSLRRTRFF